MELAQAQELCAMIAKFRSHGPLLERQLKRPTLGLHELGPYPAARRDVGADEDRRAPVDPLRVHAVHQVRRQAVAMLDRVHARAQRRV